MFHLRHLFCCILLHLIIATPQLNLYYTDWVSESKSESDNELQHDCLRDVAYPNDQYDAREIISYCLSVLPSEFNIENNVLFPKFTFLQLSKQNISSQQLYLWSAPIDLIESYQFYLNQLSTLNDSSLAKKMFYNCTLPRFGPKCQYELDYFSRNHSSLNDIMHDFYRTYGYNPTNLTCYTHLKCNRGPFPSCLDWSEICDGKIDCLDGGFDEEQCWQLEINECKDNEYRCINGQCIPKSFYRDNNGIPDCVDSANKEKMPTYISNKCPKSEPSFVCQDMTCKERPLTSSCTRERHNLLWDAMHSIKDNSTFKKCWSASKCILQSIDSEKVFCDNFCAKNACIDIILNNCSDILYIPNTPVLFGHVYFAYKKSNILQYLTTGHIWVPYICYDTPHYDAFFDIVPKISLNNKTCFVYETISNQSSGSNSLSAIYPMSLTEVYNKLKRYHLSFNYTSAICNRLNMYQCVHSSKCISIHRVMDTIDDCPHMDDENITGINNPDIIEQLKKTRLKCQTTNTYIPQSWVGDGFCDCGYPDSDLCDDEDVVYFNSRKNILFQTICDGFVELSPIITEGQNETDETNCEQWECNNIYTHCNDLWNCLNGADEVGCNLSPLLNCPSNHHLCVSPQTNQLICINFTKVNDGKVDCLGATDEPILCRQKYTIVQSDNFYCMNQTLEQCIDSGMLCDGYKDCEHADDEQFCEKNRTIPIYPGICWEQYLSFQSDVEKVLCNRMQPRVKDSTVYFTLDIMSNSVEYKTKNIENTIFSTSSLNEMSRQYQPRCHRGFDLRVWLNNTNNLTTNTCLCPPSFYGNICQYQNQRISLTIKFRAFSDTWQTLFAIIISLIDDSEQQIIHSYEQATFLSLRDCKIKFNIYLLYSTRPKNETKHYSVHIDIYEKVSLKYRGSILLPIAFPFLPVHRLAFIVDIPRSDDNTQTCSNVQCIHGKCIKYSNQPKNFSFCQCDQGWSGKYCTIQHTCMCSSDSLCIGVSANNRSICVCPMNQFGPRCLLTDTTCQTNDNSTCQNGGQCIPNDDYLIPKQKFACICRKGYSGDQCQVADNQLILSFDENIILSQSIFIHFIEVPSETNPIRGSTFRTIPVKQNSVKIYWSQPFHLVFIELLEKNYYLTVVQKTYNQSAIINKMIKPFNRCPHIHELFNETFAQWHLLRRIKYYHLPCLNQSLNLSCFYDDDDHLCLCDDFGQKRLANCFKFDHHMTFNCLGQSVCENRAHCLQDHPTCPTRSMCICLPCFYGIKCQFSTKGFGLSLDTILSYHILPNVSLNDQPFIIKMTLALTIIFILAGLIDGIFSMMVFKNRIVRDVGCGLYLLGSSITTLLTMIIFGLKFLILLLAQMTIISNRSFLSFQCYSIDFLLRVCLNMGQWLNACVAVERTMTVIKGTGFVKKKSKKAAKLVIIILLIVIIGTSIHDPIYRRLDDEESNDDNNIKRIWCIIRYPLIIQMYNSIINTFHFFGPVLINLISAIILIKKKSRQQLNVQTHRTYKEILREQFRQHKNLLTGPIVLVILALPRLIITFVSKCMESTSDSWLFLVGYFISFIPPMLTFIIYILPSEFYKKEFKKTFNEYRSTICANNGHPF